MAYALKVLLAFMFLAFAGGYDREVLAQTVPAKAAAKEAADKAASQKKSVDAQKSYAAGTRAFESGKHDQAIQLLTTALRGGGLPAPQMAKALFLRGQSYRKQGKPGLAISDLTSAVWLKGGLSDSDRTDALAQRSAAYSEAGLTEQTAGVARVVAAAPEPAKAPAKSNSGGGGFFPWLTGGGSSASTSDPAPAAEPPPATKPAPSVSSGWETATLSSNAASPTKSSVASDAPASQHGFSDSPGRSAAVQSAPAASAPPSSSGSGGGFFSTIGSLFSGSSSSSTSSVGAAAPAAPVSATSSWSESTEVIAGRKGTSAAVAAPTRVAAVVQPPSTPAPPQFKGKFRLQVAAVRSREEATALANKLQQNHGPGLAGRSPSVDEAVIGAMGKFYRVRVGPYADAGEPRKLCGALKADGFDCLIVSQ